MQVPLTDIIIIYKMQRTGNAESYPNTANYTNVNATISPTNEDIQTSEGGVYSYQLFEVFIWDTTVNLSNGDKIVSNNSVTYLVTGTPNLYNNRFVQGIRTLAKVVT